MEIAGEHQSLNNFLHSTLLPQTGHSSDFKQSVRDRGMQLQRESLRKTKKKNKKNYKLITKIGFLEGNRSFLPF